MEENYNNKTDLLFRRKLGEEEATPPDFTWPEIKKRLDKPSRKPGGWIWWLSGVLLLLGTGGTLFYYSDSGKKLFADNKKSLATGWNYDNPDQSDFEMVKNDSASKNKSVPVSLPIANDTSAGNKNVVTNSNPNANNNSANSTSNDPDVNSHHATSGNGSAHVKAKKNPSSSDSSHAMSSEELARILDAFNRNKHAHPGSGSGDRYVPHGDPGSHHSDGDIKHNNSRDQVLNGSQHIDTTAQTNNNIVPPHSDVVITNEPRVPLNSIEDFSIPYASFFGSSELSPPDDDPNANQLHELPPPPGADLPKFFAGVNASVSQQRIASSTTYENHFTGSDVALYRSEDGKVSMNLQSYNYGARFGWFITKHFAIAGGGYLNGYEVNSPGSFLRYNYLYQYNFNVHTATATVQLPSSSFSYPDIYGAVNDTVFVKLSSNEKYSFVNLQLGGAWYPLRTKYFSAYINALADGALLNHQQLTLTSVKSGKTFAYSGEALQGMNKFTLGVQCGAGFEFTPIRNLGIWIEPAYFISGAINPKNSFVIHPQAMRYQAGLSFHF